MTSSTFDGGTTGSVAPRVAVFSGPTATIQNSPPLVTSNAARRRHGLPLLRLPDGRPLPFDMLRLQRLAAPVTVYVEAFSGHPLESDAADLYAPPDGYLDTAGTFSDERRSPADVPVYEVRLAPHDGLYALPYMARRRDGSAWDPEGLQMAGDPAEVRQTFYPDASRIFEEIDRMGLGPDGANGQLARRATYTFHRVAPPGGYLRGGGSPDGAPEIRGEDFFPYSPRHLGHMPGRAVLASATNRVQAVLDTGEHDAAIWLEGSPTVEETAYWLNLLLDTTRPVACNSAHRPHGSLSSDGARNIVDSVDYVRSGIWRRADSTDGVGVVVVQDEQIFAAREVQKADARPGGYVATGGHGGVVGTIGVPGPPMLTFWPTKMHTHRSEVNLRRLPAATTGVRGVDGAPVRVEVQITDDGFLRPDAIPKVTIIKYVHYGMDDHSDDPATVVEVFARITRNLERFPLAGFVLEGNTPFGRSDEAEMAALRSAIAHGMPVVRTARGNAEGMVAGEPGDVFLAGNNLTSTKARLLLMACLLRFGAPPPAKDPGRPTSAEWDSIRRHLGHFQQVLDTH